VTKSSKFQTKKFISVELQRWFGPPKPLKWRFRFSLVPLFIKPEQPNSVGTKLFLILTSCESCKTIRSDLTKFWHCMLFRLKSTEVVILSSPPILLWRRDRKSFGSHISKTNHLTKVVLISLNVEMIPKLIFLVSGKKN
jgi:hypothetical protein